MKPGAKEDVVEVLLDLKKAYHNRVEYFSLEIKNVEDFIAVNKFDNDSLLVYLHKVFESSKFNLLDDTSIQTLTNFLESSIEFKNFSPNLTMYSTN